MFTSTVTDPEGVQWTVRVHIIPERKGIGFRERFLHRKKHEPNKSRWYDFLDIPTFDGIDDLWIMMIVIVIVIIFALVGWPLLLLLADFLWLIFALLGALVVYGVLGRPITVTAKSKVSAHTWNVRGLGAALKQQKTVADNLKNGVILDEQLPENL